MWRDSRGDKSRLWEGTRSEQRAGLATTNVAGLKSAFTASTVSAPTIGNSPRLLGYLGEVVVRTCRTTGFDTIMYRIILQASTSSRASCALIPGWFSSPRRSTCQSGSIFHNTDSQELGS